MLFGLVTAALICVWLNRTAGKRACTKWLQTGEPKLEAITIEKTSHWLPGKMTCDHEEAVRYFESCLANAVPWTQQDPLAPYYDNDCTVLLHFADGTEYRSPAPCRITAKGLGLSLPGERRIEENFGTSYVAFRDPMPNEWKQALRTLLGPQAVD